MGRNIYLFEASLCTILNMSLWCIVLYGNIWKLFCIPYVSVETQPALSSSWCGSDYCSLGACSSTCCSLGVHILFVILVTLPDIQSPCIVFVNTRGCCPTHTLLVVKTSLLLEKLIVRCDVYVVIGMTASTKLMNYGLSLNVRLESTAACRAEKWVETRISRYDSAGLAWILKRILPD